MADQNLMLMRAGCHSAELLHCNHVSLVDLINSQVSVCFCLLFPNWLGGGDWSFCSLLLNILLSVFSSASEFTVFILKVQHEAAVDASLLI